MFSQTEHGQNIAGSRSDAPTSGFRRQKGGLLDRVCLLRFCTQSPLHWFLCLIILLAGCTTRGRLNDSDPVSTPGAGPDSSAVTSADTLKTDEAPLTPADSLSASLADTVSTETAPAGETAVAGSDTTAALKLPWLINGDFLSAVLDGRIEIEEPRISHEGMDISAVRGVWDQENDLLELISEVCIKDSVRTIYADEALYYLEPEFLEMDRDVHGHGPEGEFSSDHLTYDRRAEQIHLGGDVHLSEKGRLMLSHWLTYSVSDSMMLAGGNVRLHDIGDSVVAYGDSLRYNRVASIATITCAPPKRPRLIQRSGVDSLAMKIVADSLCSRFDTGDGEAYGNVVFEREGIKGACGYARIGADQDRVILTRSPRIEESDGWVVGDTMSVELRGGRADKLLVWGSARTGYFPPLRAGEMHYTAGDSLTAYLEGGYIKSILVEGNAESLYHPGTRDFDSGIGLNWTSGNRLRLIMDDSVMNRIQYEGGINGRYVLPFTPAEMIERDSLRTPTRLDSLSVTSSAPADSISPVPLVPSVSPHDKLAMLGESGALDLSDSLTTALGFNVSETVIYSGEKLEFEVATDKIHITDTANITYQEMQLDADDIVFNSAEDLVIARDDPILKDPGSQVLGQVMTYRLDNRKGFIYKGRSEMAGSFYRGERIKRIDKKTYYVQDGDFTSCDQEETHFHFHADEMKLIPGEKVIARTVVLYLGNIPLMIVPYAVFPTQRGRRSGILIPQFEFGINSNAGRFIENIGYYIAPNDYVDALFWLDYRENNKQLIFNGRTNYKLRYILNGSIKSSFMRDSKLNKDRWDLTLNHNQTLGERFTMKAYGKFLSDKSYGEDKDYGAGVDDVVNRVLKSQFSISKSWSGVSLGISADRTENLDEVPLGVRISQNIPSIDLRFSSFPLGIKPDSRGRGGKRAALSTLYVSAATRYICKYQKTWADTTANDEGEITPENSTIEHGSQMNMSLSDKRRPFGIINLTPNSRITAAWTKKAVPDTLGHTGYSGVAWNAGLSASTTLYGTFFPRLGPWEGLRHVVDLSASYSYQPELRSLEGFRSVGGIGLSSSRSSRVSLRLSQRFHVKLTDVEESRKHDNLLTWNSSTSYDFMAEENDRDPWSSLSHRLNLKPGRSFSSSFSLTHDLKRWRRQSLSMSNSLSLSGGGSSTGGSGVSGEPAGLDDGISTHGGFGDPGGVGHADPGEDSTMGRSLAGPWQLSVAHSFRVGQEWSSHTSSVNLSGAISLTSNWRIQASVYYDLDTHQVKRQGVSVTRDLHCWRMRFERRGSGYYFRIFVKDLPDLKYERTRY